jgi:hypothetical protein
VIIEKVHPGEPLPLEIPPATRDLNCGCSSGDAFFSIEDEIGGDKSAVKKEEIFFFI